MGKTILKLVPVGDGEAFNAVRLADEPMTLRDLLTRAPALSTTPLGPELLDQPLSNFIIVPTAAGPDVPLYHSLAAAPVARIATIPEKNRKGRDSPDQRPEHLSEEAAVVLAHGREIDGVASFLRTGLSVLVVCDKLVVQFLWGQMVLRAQKTAKLLEVPDEQEGGLLQRGLRQRQIAELRALTRALKTDDVLVIPHLDLLAGGSESNPSLEAREIIEILYGASDRLMLAFADRSLAIPEVLAARFDVRVMLTGVSRTVKYPDTTEKLLGEALVTKAEAARFTDFDPEGFYKNVSGMNPVRLRHAIAYAIKEHANSGAVASANLYQAIRAFKVQTSSHFEVPDVTFDHIGGYDDVKAELGRAIALMTNSFSLPNDRLRRELIPRGFIFWGPPGTGKTLFAKAVANRLGAAIQVISGPEVMDMYVGESERKVREIFAEARRNAPSVLVFDEFDSIATRRSGRDDGGSRAGNAVVAQILTEMDGFRPDVPMLIIGTTNRLDIIDDALLRPTRFQAVAIDLPDHVARSAIARVHADHFFDKPETKLSSTLLEIVAGATEGFNGDEIRSIFRDACVGRYCEDPPKLVDAHRLGVLVGKIRALADQRTAAAARKTQAAPTPRNRPGARVVPSTRLTPNQPRAGASASPAAETAAAQAAAATGATS